MPTLKIIAESSIPYLRGNIEKLGDVRFLPSDEFTQENIADADWLIIRSITKCHKELLQGTKVRLITTATIGFDHIDTDYCNEAGITWANAPGCNAEAVGQYFGAAIACLYHETGFDPKSKTLGIVGVGHVGRVVERYAQALGMRVLRNDPPRAEKEGQSGFVTLETIADEADVITFHVPLTHGGNHPTFHLCDHAFISSLGKKVILMNACRGPVTDTDALLWGLGEGLLDKVIIDCWENEPDISHELLNKAWLGTPHIAGFSAQGKANGTRMCIEAGIKFFNLESNIPSLMFPSPPSETMIRLTESSHPLLDALRYTLDVRQVDAILRCKSEDFEMHRKNYFYPSEPNVYCIKNKEIGKYRDAAHLIGFQIQE